MTERMFRATLGPWALIALVHSVACKTVPEPFTSPTPAATDTLVTPPAVTATVANCTFSYECQSQDPIPNIHCAVCKNATACEQCAPGYGLHKPSGACLSCVTHCLDECTADSDPLECSACEDGYVLAVYKNWKDPPLSSEWFEDAEGCFIPRTYCFSCSDGNCAPRHCEPAEGDTQSEFVGGGFPGGCTKCPSDSVPIPEPCAPDDDRCIGPQPYMCTLSEGSCTNCTRYCLNASQAYCEDWVGSTCTRCGPHCSECEPDQPNNCTNCFDGFHLVNDSCIPNTEGCADDSCLECSSADWCTKCKPGLMLGEFDGKCFASRNCTVADCNKCMYNDVAPGQDLCFWCSPGFYGSERPPVGAGNIKCAPCEKEGCAACYTPAEGAGNCSSCLPGYFDTDQGWGDAGPYTTCVKCTVPNCDSCSAPGDKCNFCSAGFVVNTVTSKCVAEADMIPCEERKCDQCNSLYFFSSGDDCTSCGKDRTCRRVPKPKCPEHCTECEGDVCKVCDEGFHLADDLSGCEKPCMDNCSGSNCEDDPLTGGKICYSCYSGYFWDDVQLACVPS